MSKPLPFIHLTKSTVIACICAVMSGCAVMSVKECQVADWHDVGYRDGAYGRYTTHFSQYLQACQKAQITPDRQAWQAGRESGLKQYCTASNAYHVGKRGNSLQPVCPTHQTNVLQKAYDKGYEVYVLEKQIKKLADDIKEEDEKLQTLKQDYQTTKKEELSKNIRWSYKTDEILSDINQAEYGIEYLKEEEKSLYESLRHLLKEHRVLYK